MKLTLMQTTEAQGRATEQFELYLPCLQDYSQ
jgi:hypothetical protein